MYGHDGGNTTWQNVPTKPDLPCITDCHGFRVFLESEPVAQLRAIRISFAHYGEMQEYFDDPCGPCAYRCARPRKAAWLCNRWHGVCEGRALSATQTWAQSCVCVTVWYGHLSVRCRALTSWPPGGGGAACFSNGWHFPKPPLQRVLLPTLQRMEGMRALTAIHFRLGFVDWVQTVPDAALAPRSDTNVSVADAWRQVERALRQCPEGGADAAAMPCVEWALRNQNAAESPDHTMPTLELALTSPQCARALPNCSAGAASARETHCTGWPHVQAHGACPPARRPPKEGALCVRGTASAPHLARIQLHVQVPSESKRAPISP